jgi:hypothetical protein|nr:MAG TPA: hypothetical protein [Crassvirales sp.]
MNFLDESGIKKLWTKIKANFGTAIVNNSDYQNVPGASGLINIPFVANHQIVNMDITFSINVYKWFQKASKGGILEVVFAGAQGGSTYCSNNGNSYMYKMHLTSEGPFISNIGYLITTYDTYTRLIKTDDDKLVVAMFVQNKQ